MPFRNRFEVLTARGLELLGTAGEKIIGTVVGGPRIDFYTGSANETAPGSIYTQIDTPVPGEFALILEGPDSASTSQAQLILGSLDTNLTNGNQGGILGLIHAHSGNAIRVGPQAFGGVSIDGNLGGIQLDGQVNILGDGIKGLAGRRIEAFSGGNASDNTSGGNGTLNFPHDLGGPGSDVFIVCQPAGVGRNLTRITSGDTSTTFRCEARTLGGAVPANGTNVACHWVGVKTV